MIQTTDPKYFEKKLAEVSQRISQTDAKLESLKVLYNLDWKREDLIMLMEYLESGKEIPNRTEVFCRQCRDIYPITLLEFINYQCIKDNYVICGKCRSGQGYYQWKEKCEEHGFQKEHESYKISNWDCSIHPTEQIRLKDFAERYINQYPKVKSLFITGKTGGGKSRYVQTIGLELLRKGCNAVYEQYTAFSKLGRSSKNEDDRWINAGVLILDDFVEKDIGFAYGQWVFPILNTRYEKGKPTIITSNLLIEEDLKPSTNEFTHRLYSRFSSNRYSRLLFTTEDLRKHYE